MPKFLLLLLVLVTSLYTHAQEKMVTAGMKITGNTKIKKGTYNIDAPLATNRSIILIEGNNITVDFANVTLQGSNKETRPDEFAGVAVLIRNSRNVTIRNLKARGYKIALMARNVEGLVLEQCDFSYNYRSYLNSTQDKEDVSDWMSYHHNEKDEWLRYGAAIYLRDCYKAIIKNCVVTGGQNALMMTACNDGKIFNNDFSFNSGIGIGMYRCNRNEVSYNRVNFNVRGHSVGVYNRGQDSAGILVYEQSSNNIFYKNSVTHSGDGFFLWAGQTTMDTGKGGCNDNILLENDFSYAPTNGIEVTFSRNFISGNRIFGCDHGIWGGYSYFSIIKDNKFRDNRIAIAIEHGQHNEIFGNLFSKDKEAIRLWARKQQPSDWGYAKYRDTRSTGYTITRNSFNGNETVFNFSRTDSLRIYGNTFFGHENIFKIDSTVAAIDSSDAEILLDTIISVPSVKNPFDPFSGNGKMAGRKNIMMTEWGPYDFRYPIIWNTNPKLKFGNIKFDLIGPKGKWLVKSFKGVEDLSAMSGEFPATLTAKKLDSLRIDIEIVLEYIGTAIVTPFGKTIAAGKPYKFTFRKFFLPIDWEVNFFAIDTASHNPIRTGELFSPTERKAPIIIEGRIDRLEYAWWGGIKAGGTQYPQFMTISEGTGHFPKGVYELAVTWDDAVRVYLDNKLVLDEWNPSRYTFDQSPNSKIRINLDGKHEFRVEHVELGGFATLMLKIKPVEPRPGIR